MSKCPWTDVMDANVRICLSREILWTVFVSYMVWVCECVSVLLMVLNLFLAINAQETLSSLADSINQCVQEQQLRKSSQLLVIPGDYSLLRNLAIFQGERCF